MHRAQIKPYKRTSRVAQQIQRELAEIFLRKTKDPRLSSLTITGVEVTPDFKTAKVRVSKLLKSLDSEPTDKEVKELMKALESATPFLFEQLRSSLSLKYVPWIEFDYDRSLAESAKVWALMSRMKREERAGLER